MKNKVPEELLAEAQAHSANLAVKKEELDGLEKQSVEIMNRLFENGASWAQIGRIFGCTPQAAMYKTGHSKRSN